MSEIFCPSPTSELGFVLLRTVWIISNGFYQPERRILRGYELVLGFHKLSQLFEILVLFHVKLLHNRLVFVPF
jgi:hypothetical protein